MDACLFLHIVQEGTSQSEAAYPSLRDTKTPQFSVDLQFSFTFLDEAQSFTKAFPVHF